MIYSAFKNCFKKNTKIHNVNYIEITKYQQIILILIDFYRDNVCQFTFI